MNKKNIMILSALAFSAIALAAGNVKSLSTYAITPNPDKGNYDDYVEVKEASHYSIDENGNETIYWKQVYERNANGKMTQDLSIDYDEGKEDILKNVYDYDGNGNLVKRSEYYSNDDGGFDLDCTHNYEYDNNGNNTYYYEISHSDGEETYDIEKKYQYNDKNQLIYQEDYSSYHSDIGKNTDHGLHLGYFHKYAYNEKGLITSNQTYNPHVTASEYPDGILNFETKYEYNENGDVIKETYNYYNTVSGTYKWIEGRNIDYKYDAQNRILEERSIKYNDEAFTSIQNINVKSYTYTEDVQEIVSSYCDSIYSSDEDLIPIKKETIKDSETIYEYTSFVYDSGEKIYVLDYALLYELTSTNNGVERIQYSSKKNGEEYKLKEAIYVTKGSSVAGGGFPGWVIPVAVVGVVAVAVVVTYILWAKEIVKVGVVATRKLKFLDKPYNAIKNLLAKIGGKNKKVSE